MKKIFTVYKLHFTSPIHLGDERDDYTRSLRILHSDSFYAALTASLAKAGYPFEEDFDGDLGFHTSSLFPFYQKKEETEPVYFFPSPKISFQLPQDQIAQHKKLKKVKYFDLSFFENLAAGGVPNESMFKAIQGDFCSEREIPEFMTREMLQRATVPRIPAQDGGAKDTETFYTERIRFIGESGLYFLCEGDITLLEKALDILKEEGIGTDRNVGNGYFSYSTDSISIDLPDEGDYAMNLSLYVPEDKDEAGIMLEGKPAYSLIRRGGWITTPPYNTYRKNRVYAFEEGSQFQFKLSECTVKGKIVDLKPKIEYNPIDHPIYRSGIALFIPFNRQKHE
ncbi:MAG: type III-A CRISPR-associated RAMP protein Csm4 [Candidatus Cloacimonadaceae bacterium]|nr:type III-A CRISPR-associated RAMP protein Csm4 [Bacteroidales bacterium]MDD3011466.1 type III-A CRISPR-associated RAMP protein Csm4 [Bacteroidales bacterium]MDD3962411.1 type III-A CRISPR-associated RAMP protein Csm4 [Bacteroidales bacterium]MDY0285907.1 type III-A CRISPR-associated RAMP protein Csm4 [Bacteroidales bacterium]NCD40972.1 type III-A CRISPR-associated RAMP protein Csm4 [Bacteroidia bacterium]